MRLSQLLETAAQSNKIGRRRHQTFLRRLIKKYGDGLVCEVVEQIGGHPSPMKWNDAAMDEVNRLSEVVELYYKDMKA